MDLYVVGLDDRKPVRLTRDEADEKRPTVSPDGRWVVFESDRAGGSQLFVMPADGSETRQLTREGYNFGARFVPETAP